MGKNKQKKLKKNYKAELDDLNERFEKLKQKWIVAEQTVLHLNKNQNLLQQKLTSLKIENEILAGHIKDILTAAEDRRGYTRDKLIRFIKDVRDRA